METMFVRAKKVKGRFYAYLVSNEWKDNKVSQTVKRYLGPVRSLHEPADSDMFFSLDTSRSSRACLRDCIAQEFLIRDFVRKKNKLTDSLITIDLVEGTISEGSKKVVVFLNGRYLHDGLLRRLLSFNEPDSDSETPGRPLAEAFSDAGIRIHPQVFVQLYRKLYDV